MRKFWHPRRPDEIEQLLRANRAEPREAFVTSLLERLETRDRRLRPQRLGRRVFAAAAVTVVTATAAIAAGGAHVARTSISNLVRTAGGVNSPSSTGSTQNESGKISSAGDQQYTVEICHHTSSAKNPWVDLFLSPQGAANHLKNHPLDYAVGAPGNPTTCPP
jgi:hypothetical protein